MTREEAIKWLEETKFGGKILHDNTVIQVCDMAVAALREQEERRWIPVTERLPNVFEGVLAYCPKRRNTYLLYINARGEWHFFDRTVAGALLDEAVTHWMTMPEPPKEI